LRTHPRLRQGARGGAAIHGGKGGQKFTGIAAEKIERAAEIYARGPNTSSLWAMGLTQHANGTTS